MLLGRPSPLLLLCCPPHPFPCTSPEQGCLPVLFHSSDKNSDDYTSSGAIIAQLRRLVCSMGWMDVGTSFFSSFRSSAGCFSLLVLVQGVNIDINLLAPETAEVVAFEAYIEEALIPALVCSHAGRPWLVPCLAVSPSSGPHSATTSGWTRPTATPASGHTFTTFLPGHLAISCWC